MKGRIRWTIAMKVGSIISVLILFILGLLIHSIIALSEIQADLKEIADLDVPLVEVSNEIEVTQLELHIEMDELLRKNLKAGETDFDGSRLKFLSGKVYLLIDKGISIAETGTKLEAPQSAASFKRVSAALKELKTDFSGIDQALARLTTRLPSKEYDNAELVSHILNSDERFDKKAIRLIQTIQALTERKEAIAVRHEQAFKIINVSLSAIGVSLGVLLGILIVTGIRTNIFRLSKRMEEVTTAIKENRRIPVGESDSINSSDELGGLSEDLSNMIDSLADDIARRDEVSKQLYEMATIDHLTKSFNRLKFDEAHRAEVERSKRTGADVTLVVFDIDHFKRINDGFGHDVGDTTLIDVVKVASNAIRNIDTLYRTGGEAFAVLLPDTTIEDGAAIAERIRADVENHTFDKVGQVTISLGAAGFNHSSDNAETWVKRADEALYQSKETGRNRVSANHG